MNKTLIVSLLISLYATIANAENPTAVEGSACPDESTLSDMQAAKPLICADGKWRKVVFKTDADGAVSPLFYEGKCSWRYTEGGSTNASITVKSGRLADICLPVGWRVHMAASYDSAPWVYYSQASMPNVLLVKAIGPGHRTTLFVYPSTSEGKASQKLEIQLRSVK